MIVFLFKGIITYDPIDFFQIAKKKKNILDTLPKVYIDEEREFKKQQMNKRIGFLKKLKLKVEQEYLDNFINLDQDATMAGLEQMEMVVATYARYQ